MQQNQSNQLRELANYLTEQVNSGKLTEELATKYGTLSNHIVSLCNQYDILFTRDDSNKLPLMDLAKRDEIVKICQDIANVSSEIEQIKPSKKLDKILLDTNTKVQDFVSKDIKALIKVKEPCTLASAIQSGRKRVIDITGQDTKIVGGAQSHRLVINDGNDIAFFTENQVYNEKTRQKTYKDFKNKYVNSYPEYAKFFKSMCDPYIYRFLDAEAIHPKNMEIMNGLEYMGVEFPDMATIIKNYGQEEFYRAHCADPDFMQVFYQFVSEAQELNASRVAHDAYLQLHNNEPVDERNTGMSIVAELLGCGDLLAHSESVTIIKDGKEINGTLMNKAEGIDINNSDLNDPIHTYKPSVMNNTDAKKQLADIQVIDFICGNIDRHSGNMFYSFDTSNPNSPKCNKIVGIDNDLSFTHLDPEQELKGCNRMVGLATMKVITEEMAEKVKALTPEMLKLALRGLKIDNNAIEKTVNRFKQLQTLVRERSVEFNGKTADQLIDTSNANSIEEARINIIKEEKWEGLIPHSIHRSNVSNAFRVAVGAINLANDDLSANELATLNVWKAKSNLKTSLLESKEELKAQHKKVKSGTSIFRGTSEQYENIVTQMNELKEYQANMPKNANDKEIKNYMAKLQEAVTSTQAYLDRKEQEKQGGKKFGRYTNNRIKVMAECNKYLQEKIHDVNGLVEKRKKAEKTLDQVTRNISNQPIKTVDEVKKELTDEKKKNLNVNKSLINKEATKEETIKAKSTITK